MGTVDFGPLEPTEHRADIERLASLLPAGWTVSCSTAESSPGVFCVTVRDAVGTQHASGQFKYEVDFDGVAKFLEEVALLEKSF